MFVQEEFKEMMWLDSRESSENSTGSRGYDKSIENLHRSGSSFQDC